MKGSKIKPSSIGYSQFMYGPSVRNEKQPEEPYSPKTKGKTHPSAEGKDQPMEVEEGEVEPDEFMDDDTSGVKRGSSQQETKSDRIKKAKQG